MPFCVIKSRTIKFILAMSIVVICLCIGFEGSACSNVWFGSSSRLVPIYRVRTDEKQVALSFDAAWGADKTEEIMQVLKEYEVNATFFLVGFWIEKYPELVKKIDENGFEIGTHSNTHPDMAKLDESTIRSELSISISKIKEITNKDVKVFRPPFGSYNNTLLKVCEEMKLKAIQWDVDSLDWKGLSAASVTKRVMNKTKNGSIILMHNNAENVIESLRLTLDWLKMKGYKVLSVGDLVFEQDYYIDGNGEQIKR